MTAINTKPATVTTAKTKMFLKSVHDILVLRYTKNAYAWSRANVPEKQRKRQLSTVQ